MNHVLVRALVIVCAILALLLWKESNAETKKFPLGKPILEEVGVCGSEAIATALISAVATKDKEAPKLFQMAQMMGYCGGYRGPVTYLEQVFRQEADGKVYTVYRATIGETNVWIPMEGFEHEAI